MLESSVVDEWVALGEAKGEAEGRAKGEAKGRILGRRENLMLVLQFRFPTPIPSDLETAIQSQTDLDTLSRWFDASLRSASLDEFRAVMLPQD